MLYSDLFIIDLIEPISQYLFTWKYVKVKLVVNTNLMFFYAFHGYFVT